MSEARCMLGVQGLDCPIEAQALHGALKDVPGVFGLDFDLIHGTMMVRFDPETLDAPTLVEHVAGRAGMKARVLGEPEVSTPWWSRHRRWVATGGAGLALLVGALIAWFNGPLGKAQVAYILAIGLG